MTWVSPHWSPSLLGLALLLLPRSQCLEQSPAHGRCSEEVCCLNGLSMKRFICRLSLNCPHLLSNMPPPSLPGFPWKELLPSLSFQSQALFATCCRCVEIRLPPSGPGWRSHYAPLFPVIFLENCWEPLTPVSLLSCFIWCHPVCLFSQLYPFFKKSSYIHSV